MSVPAVVIPERVALPSRATVFVIVLELVDPSVPPARATDPLPSAVALFAFSVPWTMVVPPE